VALRDVAKYGFPCAQQNWRQDDAQFIYQPLFEEGGCKLATQALQRPGSPAALPPLPPPPPDRSLMR
jgi:hypothetical protein